MKIEYKEYTKENGIYVCAELSKKSLDVLNKWLIETNPPFSIEYYQNEAHMTIMYSKHSYANLKFLEFPTDNIFGLSIAFEYWEGHDKDGYVVLKIISDAAKNLNKRISDSGAEHSFNDYTSHVTINNKVGPVTDDVKHWLEIATAKIKKTPFILEFDAIKISDCKQ